MLLITGDGILI